MSSLRRACGILTAVGLLGTLATVWLPISSGEDKPKPAPIVARGLKRPLPVPAPAPAPVPAALPAVEEQARDPEFTDGLTLPTDRNARRKLEDAADFIKEQNWDAAAEILQRLLDIKEDLFVEVHHKDAKGQIVTDWTSIRTEANRLLGTMPAGGLEVYELKFGGQAKARLAEGKIKSDPAILAEVALKYQHTEAGAEATNLLGTYGLDRGDYVRAALCFERLLHHQNADKLQALTLFKATLAFRRVGDAANAQKAWERLVKVSRDGLRLGEKSVPLDQLEAMLAKIAADNLPASLFDWTMFGGGPSRTAQGNGSAPYLADIKWTQPTIRENQTRTWIDQAVANLESRKPVLPAFYPIASTVRADKGLLPLLVYRSYWGVHAVDLRTGKLWWESPSSGGLDKLAKDSQKMQTIMQWWQFYQNSQSQHVLFENSVLGTLSTDGNRVYLVDDLALPPHPQYMMQFQWGGVANLGTLADAVYHNTLQAFDLESGKILWELGGREDPDKPDVLADSYFLGAPLPLGGKLYVLNERKSELRLLCLDPLKKGAVSWVQTLANARDAATADVGRRMQAANVAYGEGILVCPTNAGAVLGVDLLTHSLVWARSYRQPPPNNSDPNNMRLIRAGVMNGNMQSLNPDWKVSAPAIQDGKVVFTAPDGQEVHCLDLRTGKPLWNAPRSDDLYLGGVFDGKVLLVGKSTCRALSLADGKQVWTRETGLPSGQGVASKNIYYLPLKSAAKSKEPEVCAIDITTGDLVGHSGLHKRSADNNEEIVPGNLLFFEGDVISQTAKMVVAFPQLEVKLFQISERLKNNPHDPTGLTERGEMKLDKGDLAGALEDLQTALANKPPTEILPKTRSKMFETLTELFQKDFTTSERYLDQYEEMCKVAPEEDTPDGRLKAAEEQQRRQANFLCLVAKGREKQGRLVDAFDAYMKFGALNGNKELVSVVDEPTVKARPDVWAQGRIAAMIARATEEQRRPLEGKIAQQWRTVRATNDLDALRRFVDVFGSFAAGKEARLELAERCLEGKAFLEAELNLQQLRNQEDRQLAGQAVEALARLNVREDRMQDAADFYKKLAREFPDTVIRDNKTGADFYNELATDKRFLPYIDEPLPLWGRMKAKEISGSFPPTQQTFYFEPEGEVLPFFQRFRLVLVNNAQVKLVDRLTGEAKFTQNIPNANVQYLYNGYNARFPYRVLGHLLVFNLGHMVYGFDAAQGKLLWEKDLLGAANLANLNQQQRVMQDQDGCLEIIYPDGFRQKVGRSGPVEASYVCLQTRQGLVALDPLKGTTLWTRTDLSPQTQIFGDEKHVYLLEVRENGTVGTGRALRAQDGVSVNVPDFGPLYKQRLRTLGRNLLLSETDAQGALSLRLYDVHSGKNLWKRTFSPKAMVIQSEEPELIGVVEPNKDCRVTVMDLRTQKDVLVTRVSPKDLDKVPENGVNLLRDNDYFYLAFNAAPDPAANPWGGPWSNLNPGMRSMMVNGNLYCFHRDTGKLNWKNEVSTQMIVLDQFKDLPVVLFTGRYNRPINPAGGIGRGAIMVTATKSMDKRTGKLLYDKEIQNNGQQFYALNTDPRAGTIELVSYNLKIQHYIDTTTGGRDDLKEGQKTSRKGSVSSSSVESAPQSAAIIYTK